MAAIVGRERELAALQAFMLEATQRPTVFVLEGEPGSGKTTQLTDLPPTVRRALDVALTLADRLEEAVDQHAIAAATRASFTLLANEQPLLLAIDEVQWLDAPSLRAVAFALRRVTGVPLGALLATRDTTRLLSALPRAAVTTLGPLSFGAMGNIVRARVAGDVSRGSVPLVIWSISRSRLRPARGGSKGAASALLMRASGATPPDPVFVVARKASSSVRVRDA